MAALGVLAFQPGWLGGGDAEPLADSSLADGGSDQPEPRVDPDAADGEWRRLPDAPLAARTEQAAVWAGDRLLLWGGAFDDGFERRTFLADGAALDAGNAWSGLPEAPLSARTGHAAVWTGSELLIWGGEGSAGFFADGAAYDPATGTWRSLPEAPLSPRAGIAAVWTGDALLLVGGRDNGGPLSDGAAFDPASRTWRTLPPLPETLERAGELRGVEAGDAAVFWSPGQGGLALSEIARFDPATDAWAALPNPSDGESGIPLVAWDGQELLALLANYDGTGARLMALSPGAQDWQERGATPTFDDPWEASAAWTDEALLVALGDAAPSAVRYEPASDLWTRLPEAPLGEGWHRDAVWTGEQLLILEGASAAEPGAPLSGAAWRFTAR
ncbi:MAG: hypothetical protein GEU81_06440 [Nitriliruptorales bacterium]|nr:hypothetical protein [Nitriliruptorales bacterium]